MNNEVSKIFIPAPGGLIEQAKKFSDYPDNIEERKVFWEMKGRLQTKFHLIQSKHEGLRLDIYALEKNGTATMGALDPDRGRKMLSKADGFREQMLKLESESEAIKDQISRLKKLEDTAVNQTGKDLQGEDDEIITDLISRSRMAINAIDAHGIISEITDRMMFLGNGILGEIGSRVADVRTLQRDALELPQDEKIEKLFDAGIMAAENRKLIKEHDLLKIEKDRLVKIISPPDDTGPRTVSAGSGVLGGLQI